MFRIMGSYNGKEEELDTAEDKKTANYLVQEYQIAFGKHWTIRIIEKGESDGIQSKRRSNSTRQKVTSRRKKS